jgi:3-oxoacyl-[acyl-carrier protein] reductase
MEIDLSGKNALITGGASGIGRACAITLARAGAEIALVDVNQAGMAATTDAAGTGTAVRCDLGDPDQIARMHDQVIDVLGGVDILVHCAGLISYLKGIGGVPLEAWDRVLEVNLRGTFLVCQAFIEAMKARRDGRIIAFSSLAARVGGIEVGLHYTASKAGLIGLTRTLAKEAGPYGITVNAVAPGFILTGPVQQHLAGREQEIAAQIPLRRLGEPQDVADVVLFLASPLARYITGAVIDINGGIYMG